MTPEQYHNRVLAQLDTMKRAEKDAILIGLLAALYPNGDPDHAVSGADFIAEAVRLLAAFHPVNLSSPEQQPDIPEALDVPGF